MSVRWQKCEDPSDWWEKSDIGWDAVLTEATRVGGEPGQRSIGRIASVRQSQIDMGRVNELCRFWDNALERLYQLSNQVSEQDRESVIATLAEKVPVPTREEYELYHRGIREMGLETSLPEHPLYELPANTR
jgi:hypothetical protein